MFPSLAEATRYLTDDIAKQLDLTNEVELSSLDNNYGSFVLKEFTNFNDKFFENDYNPQEFAKNFKKDSYDRVTGRCALLSLKTIAKDSSIGNSRYNKKFDTAHVLAQMLVGKLADFDSSKNNRDNIFPQTTWSNGGIKFSFSKNKFKTREFLIYI